MLHFHNLNRLSHHHDYLTSILGQKKFFFVGWLIRDLLLDRETNMDDVDITMGGTHADIKVSIHDNIKTWDKEFSLFDTEKYGTMTIIPKTKEILDPSSEILGSEDNILGTRNQDLLAGRHGPRISLQYEITPFRTETTYSDGRHPDEVVRSDSLLDDSQRRDFTINCMYYTRVIEDLSLWGYEESSQSKIPSSITDSSTPSHHAPLATSSKKQNDVLLLKSLEKNWRYYDEDSQTLIIQNHEIIEKVSGDNPYTSFSKEDISWTIIHLILDPHHGIQDLIDKKIKAVWLPDRRFQEDALRVIRALRFAIALECDIEKTTRTSLQKNAHLIRQIAKERIKQECDKVFAGDNPFGFVSLLNSANLLKRIFPKVYDNKWVDQPIRYHPFDVYTHTLMVLYHTQQLTNDRLVRYAALYHDVGKVEQYSSYNMKLDEEGVRDVFKWWLNHVICGAEFITEDFKKLWASTKEIETIARYVRRHMKPGEILMGDPTHYKKKLRPLIAEVGPEMVKNLCLLTIGDRLGQYNPIQAPAIDDIYALIDMIDEIMNDEGRFTLSQLAINGTILMQELQMKPWPELWKLLTLAYERVLEDLTRNNKKTLLDMVKQWSL